MYDVWIKPIHQLDRPTKQTLPPSHLPSTSFSGTSFVSAPSVSAARLPLPVTCSVTWWRSDAGFPSRITWKDWPLRNCALDHWPRNLPCTLVGLEPAHSALRLSQSHSLPLL